MGRATIEANLMMSADEVAGPKQQAKKTDRDIAYYGKQGGRVMLKELQLQVSKPSLRDRNPKPSESGEVEIPAYQVMNSGDATLADRMLQIIIAVFSTRKYAGIIPEMAHTVGVSKSQISRATIEAGEEVLKALAEKTFHDLEIVAVWIDGIQFAESAKLEQAIKANLRGMGYGG